MTQVRPEEILRNILTSRVYEAAQKTPLDYAHFLSQRLGRQVYIKREDMQPVFSYKIRGAYNKMSSLTKEQLSQGVVVASAGNHAQGVAMSANKLGCDATIVMPTTTPSVKIESVRRFGADIRIVGDVFDEAYEYALELEQSEGKIYVSPFDDPLIIAGQGTVGLEILNQHPRPIEAIFVPVGGGGLIAGVSAYVKQVRPEIKIIGVEPVDADAMYQSLQKGRRVMLDSVGIFADGVAVKQVGEMTFEIAKQYVDEIVRVTTDEMCAAIKDIFEESRSIMEPSGALAVAGMKKWLATGDHSNANASANDSALVAIASGANMNFDRLRHVAERAEIGERREAVLAVTIPEQKGSFLRFCNIIGSRSISEFNYRYADHTDAHIFVGIKIANANEVEKLVNTLRESGYATLDLTDNEMAKVHARHMVGGRMPQISDERLFSFEFPERPGALSHFLNQLGESFNISLFHYRNHGSDFGRVLCAIQIPQHQQQEFDAFLQALGYKYTEETENPVYELFLK